VRERKVFFSHTRTNDVFERAARSKIASIQRPHRRSRSKHPSLNWPGTPWKSWIGGGRGGAGGGRGKRGRSWRRWTVTPSSHFRGAQTWRSHFFAPRKLPRRARIFLSLFPLFLSLFPLKRAPFLFARMYMYVYMPHECTDIQDNCTQATAHLGFPPLRCVHLTFPPAVLKSPAAAQQTKSSDDTLGDGHWGEWADIKRHVRYWQVCH
jgi:hypothetical protein